MSRTLLPDAMTCRQARSRHTPCAVRFRRLRHTACACYVTIRAATATRSRREPVSGPATHTILPSSGGLPYGPQPPYPTTLLPVQLACQKPRGNGVREKGDKSNFCQVRPGTKQALAAEIGLIPFFSPHFPPCERKRTPDGPGGVFARAQPGHGNSGPLSQRDQGKTAPGQRAQAGCRRCASSSLDATCSLRYPGPDFNATFQATGIFFDIDVNS